MTLQTVLPLLLLLAAVGAFIALLVVDKIKRKSTAIENGDAISEELAVNKRLMTLLEKALPWLVTQAEVVLGGGTGEIKQSYVIAEILKLLPDNIKGRIKEDVLIEYIEKALSAVRGAWSDAELLNPEPDFVSVEAHFMNAATEEGESAESVPAETTADTEAVAGE
jgi:hypothetical protein